MATQALDPRDAHTYRIRIQHETFGPSVKEVVAVYHKNENGFVAFKDNAHATVFSVADSAVLDIERLRTHVLLAIADDELHLITGALRELAGVVFRADDTSDAAAEVERLTQLADSLERLNDVAAERAAADASSLPRSTPAPRAHAA